MAKCNEMQILILNIYYCNVILTSIILAIRYYLHAFRSSHMISYATFTLAENVPKMTNRLLFGRNSGVLFTHIRQATPDFAVFGKQFFNWACSLCADFSELPANQETVRVTAAQIKSDIQHLFTIPSFIMDTLVQNLERFPACWDCRCREFSNRDKKKQSFENLAELCGYNYQECVTKYKQKRRATLVRHLLT